MLSDSPTKIELIDPFISSLVQNIRSKRSMLKGLESITFNKDFINIVSDNSSKGRTRNRLRSRFGS